MNFIKAYDDDCEYLVYEKYIKSLSRINTNKTSVVWDKKENYDGIAFSKHGLFNMPFLSIPKETVIDIHNTEEDRNLTILVEKVIHLYKTNSLVCVQYNELGQGNVGILKNTSLALWGEE